MSKCRDCPVSGDDCPGLAVPRLCTLAGTRGDYRRLLREHAGELAPRPVPTRAGLARVRSCPDRECPDGCLMSRCRAGLGPRATGEVSLYDCLECPRLPAASGDDESRPDGVAGPPLSGPGPGGFTTVRRDNIMASVDVLGDALGDYRVKLAAKNGAKAVRLETAAAAADARAKDAQAGAELETSFQTFTAAIADARAAALSDAPPAGDPPALNAGDPAAAGAVAA